MFVYSNKIIRFVNEIKTTVKEILAKEVRLKVTTNRFYDRREESSYPIKIVVYNNKSMLGYFDSDFYELGFHECLMHSSRQQLHNVIRHELAHYVTFINYGGGIQAHAAEFRNFCLSIGWGEDVYRAKIYLDEGANASDIEENSVLRKVQKLMALSTSSNENEAEQALIKSQQLLLKHNIESKYIDGQEDDKIFVKRILKQPKENAKMRAIAYILETFFVNTIYNRGGDFIYLEIMGDAVNIEIAEYVANVLQGEFDKMWSQAQKSFNLKGMVAKNSFFLGISRGYCNKIEALKKNYQSDVAQSLMIIEKKLVDAKDMIYERLSSRKSNASYCHASSTLGEQMGRQLNINPALNRSAKNSEAFISYSA
ncbi:MAG: DUF2786 domain-containing protein [Parachlamydiaceae bacterium]